MDFITTFLIIKFLIESFVWFKFEIIIKGEVMYEFMEKWADLKIYIKLQ